MGLFACILFGIIASWIGISVYPKIKPVKGWFVLFTGAIGGVAGAWLGRYFQFADLDKFNMYSVGMGMVAGLIVTSIVSLTKRTANMPQAELALIDDEENY